MNYNRINWTDKSALTKDDLNAMDSGIAGCVEALNTIGNPISASEPLVFKSGIIYNTNVTDSDKVYEDTKNKKAIFKIGTITFDPAFSNSNYVLLASAHTSRPGNVVASATVASRDENRNPNSIEIYLNVTQDSTGVYYTDVAVSWIVIGKQVV